MTLRRSLAVVGISALAVAASTLVASPARAVCSLSGTGDPADPYLITSAADLQCYHDTRTYWDAAFDARQTVDIDMSGVVWANGIGDASVTGSSFYGRYHGDGHTISNLTVTNSSSTDVMLGVFSAFDTGASVSDLGIVNVTISSESTAGKAFAGGLVAQASANTSVERVFVTGSITAISRADMAWAGGILAESGYGALTDSYSRATVTADTTAGGLWPNAGGLFGQFDGGFVADHGDAATRGYAAGAVRALGDDPDNTYGGGIAGKASGDSPSTPGQLNAMLWDTDATGHAQCRIIEYIEGSCVGFSTPEMKSLSTYASAGWDITYGLTGTSTWGICPNVNGGYPFLRVFDPAGPCEFPVDQTPPPWYQSYARSSADEPCLAGWYPSWDTWPWNHTGGWVCNRKLSYSSGSWVPGPSS